MQLWIFAAVYALAHSRARVFVCRCVDRIKHQFTVRAEDLVEKDVK
jgi:hypothetical protein